MIQEKDNTIAGEKDLEKVRGDGIQNPRAPLWPHSSAEGKRPSLAVHSMRPHTEAHAF